MANELTLYFRPKEFTALLDAQPDLITITFNLMNESKDSTIIVFAQGVDANGTPITSQVGPCPFPCKP